MKRRVLAQWNQFRAMVMPHDAPPVQVMEMKRAFYAGAECALNRLASEMSSGDSLDDPNDERVLQEVNQEFQEFAEDVQNGRA